MTPLAGDSQTESQSPISVSFKTSFIITLVSNLLILLLDKGAGLIILHLLADAPDTKGALDLLTTIPPLLMVLSNLGLATSLVYFARRNEVSVRVAGETTGVVAIVWGSVISVAALLVIIWVVSADEKVDLPPWWLLVPLVGTTPFMLLTSYRNSILLVLQRIKHYNLIHLIPSLSYLPCFLIIYFVCSEKDAISSGILARFFPAIVTAGVVVYLLRKDVSVKPRFQRWFFKKAISYGWRANVVSALTYLNHRFDLFVVYFLFLPGAAEIAQRMTAGVERMTNDEAQQSLIKSEVAFYGLAVTLAEFIWYFPDAMRDLLFSKVAGISKEKAREFTPVVARNSLFICLIGATAIWFFHDPLLDFIMGDAWQRTWKTRVTPALAVLLPGTVFFTVAKVLQADLAARGRINACIFLCSLVFGSMLVVDWMLVAEAGGRGAAVASTIAYALGAIATIFLYLKESKLSLRSILIPQREDWVHYKDLLEKIFARKANDDS